MPLVPSTVGQVWEVVVHARLNGNAHINVWHFQCVQAMSDLEQRLILALLQCYSALIPKLSLGFVLEKVTYQQVKDTVGPLMEYEIPNTIAAQGAAVGDGSVSFAAACLSIPTLKPGKGSKARKYIGGIPEAATTTDDFKLDDPFWLAIVAFAACVAGKFIFPTDPAPGADKFFHLGVASRTIGGQGIKKLKPYTGNFFFKATSIRVHKQVKSMVSRKAGKGS